MSVKITTKINALPGINCTFETLLEIHFDKMKHSFSSKNFKVTQHLKVVRLRKTGVCIRNNEDTDGNANENDTKDRCITRLSCFFTFKNLLQIHFKSRETFIITQNDEQCLKKINHETNCM